MEDGADFLTKEADVALKEGKQMAVIIHRESKPLLGDYDFNRSYVYLISAIAALEGCCSGSI